MNKVITVNLNGRAYQFEETGYQALRKYLDEAEAKLAGNPDKGEIMADFEQAVADKCDRHLSAAKNVMTTNEIEEIIRAMGPVDGTKNGDAAAAGDGGGGVGKTAAPKRLYRIYEGSVLKGVCNGIAAYFNMDVTLVRVLFALLTIFTGGGWVVAYIVLMFVMPVARTEDELARAHGEPPFTAKDFIDRARAEYAKHTADPASHEAEWKEKMHAWKYERRDRSERRAERRRQREAWRAERDKWRAEHHHCGGIGALFGMIVSVVLTIIFVVALWSLIFHGMVFGHPLGIGHPLWVPIVFLIALFYIVSFPFRHLGHDSYHHEGSGFLVLLFLILFIYTAVALFPPVRDAWHSLIAYLQTVRT